MILNQLLFDSDYYVKLFGVLKPIHFKDTNCRAIFDTFIKIVEDYKTIPTSQDIVTALEKNQKIENEEYQEIAKNLNRITTDGRRIVIKQKMIDDTIKHAQQREFLQFIIGNAEKMKKDENYLQKHFGEIELDLKKISAINAEVDIGFDLFDAKQAKENFPKFRDVNTIKSGFKPWDDFTGGLEPGTLNIIQAPTNGGKSLTLCKLAADYAAKQGYNVLYVTCEMADHKIALRNQASLMDQELEVFKKTITDVDDYMQMFDLMCQSYPNHGKLWIKEYPTGQATWLTIRNLVDQIQTTKNFEFDLIIVDYLMILNTTRKVSFENLFAFQMAIAIELRGMAQIFKVPVLSAMQMTRESLKMINKQQEKVQLGVEDMSGSIGVAFTIDTLITQVPIRKENSTQYLTEDIKQVYMWINSKTRSTDSKDDRVFVGVNGAKMSLYEIDNNESKTTKINRVAVETAQKDLNSWVDDFDTYNDV